MARFLGPAGWQRRPLLPLDPEPPMTEEEARRLAAEGGAGLRDSVDAIVVCHVAT